MQHLSPLTYAYIIVSLFTFAVYAYDKVAASTGRWRIPERTLHFLDLCGGWPGGLLAQRLLRHKTRKQQFQILFWGSVLLNIAMQVGLTKVG